MGRLSISVRMDAPVVVKPDIVSKKASVKLGIAPEKYNGRHPTAADKIQLEVTSKNPSRVVSKYSGLRVRRNTGTDNSATPSIGTRKNRI